MKWINGLTLEAKKYRKEQWHLWFAWFPVVVGITGEGRKIKVWWEQIARRGEYYNTWASAVDGWDWFYSIRPEHLELAKRNRK